MSAYQEISRDFAKGDRIQFTAPSRDLGVANRDLGTIQKIEGPLVTVRTDAHKGMTVVFDSRQMKHYDHGYAVTSHSSQGVTAERVLVNMDTKAHPELINTRFAYVAVSRASYQAQIFTNDATTLGQRLTHDTSKTSAVDFRRATEKQAALDHVVGARQHRAGPDRSQQHSSAPPTALEQPSSDKSQGFSL